MRSTLYATHCMFVTSKPAGVDLHLDGQGQRPASQIFQVPAEAVLYRCFYILSAQ